MDKSPAWLYPYLRSSKTPAKSPEIPSVPDPVDNSSAPPVGSGEDNNVTDVEEEIIDSDQDWSDEGFLQETAPSVAEESTETLIQKLLEREFKGIPIPVCALLAVFIVLVLYELVKKVLFVLCR